MRQAIIGLLVCLVSSQLQAQSFTQGSEHSVALYTGIAKIQCSSSDGEFKLSQFQCRSSRMFPTESDYFLGPQGLQADQFVISVTQETGEQRATRALSYEPLLGRSRDRVELWTTSGIQRGLLGVGRNRVQWQLFSRGAKVAEGEFVSNVTRRSQLRCEPREYFSAVTSDCENQFSICEQYFQEAICN
jgi:hypothetical protein